MNAPSTRTDAVDHPAAVAEVTEAFLRYEEALVANDADAILSYFWDDERVSRFGVSDHQTGFEQVARWRRTQPALPPGRELSDTRVVAFGSDIAVVSTLFRYPDSGLLGRQTQTWAQFEDGWRIVSAHVSQVPQG